ncbi:MAG: putative Signal transduction histidine kinase [Geminicoccaceae bacterium]|nr:putative Signal transduction histidine kinase [Geminicoccaceae bacterium]
MFSGLAVSHPSESAPTIARLPRVVPRSLFSRALLIVIMPLVILQAVLAYVFYERHWDSVTRWLAVGFSGEVGLMVELLEAAKTEAAKSRVLDLAREHFDFAVSLEPAGSLRPAVETGGLLPSALDRRLQETFQSEVHRPFVIDTRPVEQPRRIAVYVQLEDGLLRVLAPRKRVDSTTTQVFIGWMVGLSLLLLILAIYFMTRQVQPILRLAWAADNFGKGRDVGDFKLAGPTEIRQAGAAFNLMRKRILRHIGQRTELLAAVSHDLRTPLTRMKLELEMLAHGKPQPGDLDDLRSDVEEMVNVVDGYLAFARGEGQESIVPTDLGPLLQEIAQRASTGQTRVEIELESPVTLPLRPIAIRRCLTNLVQNAVRYASWVGVRVAAQGDHVWIAIDDDGPGIPPDQREAVFKAFYRLDRSRNPSTGGVGLGLTIARDIVLGHGGDIELRDAPEGGLRVLVRLPS